MEYGSDDRRREPRTYVEPYDTGTYLEFKVEGRTVRCSLLDTSPGGMGMLVLKEDTEILNMVKPGDRFRMKYKTNVASVPMDFEIRHVTEINRGQYQDNFVVGLALLEQADVNL